jgi:hypothetical protein
MFKSVSLICVAVVIGAFKIALADAPPQTLFDPSRHLHVAEIKPGMKGYGLSVFSGTKIEKFDVEVVDVIKNFNPKYDAILIKCPQEFLNHTGPIAGMSGSPIYLYDSNGTPKMAGAFAYGWPFAKDCLAGVQPIEYMLQLPANDTQNDSTADGATKSHPNSLASRPRWSLGDVPVHPWSTSHPFRALGFRPMVGGSATNLRPLATPLMAGGIDAQTLARITPLFAGTGLVPMQVGTGEAGAGQVGTGSLKGEVQPQLEPGSVLAVPLLTGDMELTAVGTCTEKIGDRIFGFGHPFNNEGAIDLPMGAGSIATVVANLETSFKLGFLSGPTGALLTDQTVGVSGEIGRAAPTAPLELRVAYDDGSVDQTYHFNASLHPKLTPLIASAAIMMAIGGQKNLPQYHTVNYEVTADFADGHKVVINNSSVNGDGAEIVADVALPLLAASDNPFASVPITHLTGTLSVTSTARAAQILSVMVPKTKYQPGETVKAYVSYLPFHTDEAILPTSFSLPHDIPDGQYQLIVSDWTRYLEDERTANPFKFNANSMDELYQVIRDFETIRHDSVYLRLVRQADGVAVGHVAMPRLPSSQRQIMLDSGRSDITPFVTSTVKIVPAGLVMSGSAEFTITIERHEKVETTPGAPAAIAPAQNSPPPNAPANLPAVVR